MRSSFLKTALATGITVTALLGAEHHRPAQAAAAIPNDDKTIVHVLNRIAFGPRQDDVAKVRAIGVQAYIEQQLHPERIPDTAMSARLAGFTTLDMSSRQIAETYALPAQAARRARQQAAARASDAPRMDVPLPT